MDLMAEEVLLSACLLVPLSNGSIRKKDVSGLEVSDLGREDWRV
jgi:hypothetical protein